SGEEHFFATCPRGLEAALAAELETLGATGAHATDGGVGFQGQLDLAYTINLWSRLASRVLWQVGVGRYRDQQDIYDAALRLQWPQWFAVTHTLRVNVTAIRSPLTSLDFITLKIKDAVCDRFRTAVGERPSVDTAAPDVRIHAFLTADTCTFYLDTSGEALFKRGYRQDALEAPLRENLAAGLLKLAGWNAALPLVDPFCGSGTILIEAAMLACDMAPGFSRVFGFRHLSWFNAEAWDSVRESAARRAEAGRASVTPQLSGSDISPAAITAARANVAALGLDTCIDLRLADALAATAPAAEGVIVTNPPYGVRLGADEDLRALYAAFADTLKRHFSGWRAFVLCGEMALMKAIRLAPSRKIPLYNGALECRLVEYRLVAGSNRKQSAASEAPVGGKMTAPNNRGQ
ncbi:MAG: THUMP domain-containing class I SAM-dependent RNA methyltransferase, partial [Acidobacteriota bacterium]